MIKGLIKRIIRSAGYELTPARTTPTPKPAPKLAPELRRRLRLFERHAIDLVLDVGANAGQYGRSLRDAGWAGPIVSFEPLSTAFADLSAAAANDPRWTVHNLALGDVSTEQTLHVASNSWSSSLRPMRPELEAAAPELTYIDQQTVTVRRLDELWSDVVGDARRVYLKIDTQGHDQSVIRGAGARLADITGVQVEMSLVPLYEGEPPMLELIRELEAQGLTLMSLEPGFEDAATGRLMQVDGVFFRTNA